MNDQINQARRLLQEITMGEEYGGGFENSSTVPRLLEQTLYLNELQYRRAALNFNQVRGIRLKGDA